MDSPPIDFDQDTCDRERPIRGNISSSSVPWNNSVMFNPNARRLREMCSTLSVCKYLHTRHVIPFFALAQG